MQLLRRGRWMTNLTIDEKRGLKIDVDRDVMVMCDAAGHSGQFDVVRRTDNPQSTIKTKGYVEE